MIPSGIDSLDIEKGDALIIVDVQHDFLPGGSLAVPHGDEVIPVLNQYIGIFQAKGLPIYATRDWHPPNHCSFKSQGGPWPPHCVAGTKGAQFSSKLRIPTSISVISKATDPDKDAYSGFQGTDLDDRLHHDDILRLLIGGLATDYCVLNTVKDALKRSYKVFILQDAIRPVNVHPEDGKKAEAEMARIGAVSITLNFIAD
jgi:nicotinamidase/pyrazinamidase